MIERVVLVLVVVDAVFTIEKERTLFEAVPKAEYDVDELIAALVAQGMRIESLAVEFVAGFVVVGGDDIPAGAALAQMVNRGKQGATLYGS
jgi:hypothetical protein